MKHLFVVSGLLMLAATAPLAAQQVDSTSTQPSPSTTVIPPSPQPAAAPTTASIRTAYIGRLVDAGFPAYDIDKSGGLTAPEFAQWVLALYAKAEDANVATRMDGKAKAVYAKNAFATADTDNSKIVSKTEIYSFLIG